jgi:glycosyltransferase involved in cell wall biosynthesis
MISSPKLSVEIVTFNHAEFIAKALDSVLMQRASFEYEIVIGDDCSTDGTVQILKDFQRRCPDRVRPFFRERNVGAGRNFVDNLMRCRGEYIAWLDGDDYWTDPEKIQLQADYLDRHGTCALVHHRVDYLSWPGEEIIGEYPPPLYRVEQPDPRALAMVNYIQACSVMYRREWQPPLGEEFPELKLGDWPLCVLLNQRGWIGYIDRTMAHYRMHTGSSWNTLLSDQKLRAMEKMAWYLLQRVNDSSKDAWRDTILAIAFKDLVLAMTSLAPKKALDRLKYFVRHSASFRKPFWLFNRLWPYYYANHVAQCSRIDSARSRRPGCKLP